MWVYIVICVDDDGVHVEGVYTNKTKAEELAASYGHNSGQITVVAKEIIN